MEAAVIESEALKLSESERAILVDHLQQSLGSSKISYLDEHIEESHSRYKAYKCGEMDAVDGETFVKELRNNLQK